MIIRLIVIGLLIWVFFLVFKQVKRRQRRDRENGEKPNEPPAKIVRCAHCGVHIPSSDALFRDERAYCCPEHRNAGSN